MFLLLHLPLKLHQQRSVCALTFALAERVFKMFHGTPESNRHAIMVSCLGVETADCDVEVDQRL